MLKGRTASSYKEPDYKSVSVFATSTEKSISVIRMKFIIALFTVLVTVGVLGVQANPVPVDIGEGGGSENELQHEPNDTASTFEQILEEMNSHRMNASTEDKMPAHKINKRYARAIRL